MIPQRLYIEGFYSYLSGQEIDFTRLVSARLFGIFGATGSGKSSILEAITFALYGECERLDKRNRSYNMMNLGAKKMYLEFDFLHDDSLYRFSASAQRNSKQYEKIPSITRLAYKFQHGNWTPIPETNAATILGLSYDNFRRTIIIPQGKFQEFIGIGTSERTQMLSDLFGLSKYDLFDRAVATLNGCKTEIAAQEAMLSQIAGAKPDAIEQLSNELIEVTDKLSLRKVELESATTSYNEAQKIVEIVQRLSNSRKALSDLQKENETFHIREQALMKYERLRDAFQLSIVELDDTTNQAQQLTQKIQGKEAQQKELTKQFVQIEKAYKETEHLFENRDAFIREAEEWELIGELKSLENKLIRQDEETESLRHLSQEDENQAVSLKRQLEKEERELAEKKSQAPDMEFQTGIENWYVKYREYQQEKNHQEKELVQVVSNIESKKNEKDRILTTLKSTSTYNHLTVKELVPLVQSNVQQYQEIRSQLDDELRQLELKLKLEDLAGNLEEGHPCPLCGAIHHPQALVRSDIDQQYQSKRQEFETCELLLSGYEKALPLLELLARQAEELGKELKHKKAEQESLEEKIQLHRTLFIWQDFDPDKEEMYLNWKKEAQARQKEIETLDKEVIVLRKRITDLESGLGEHRKRLEDTVLLSRELSSTLRVKKAQLKLLTFDETRSQSDTYIQSKVQTLRQEFNRVTERYRELALERTSLTAKLETLKGEIRAESNLFIDLEKKSALLKQKTDSLLQTHDIQSIEEVRETLRNQSDVNTERIAIQNFKQQLAVQEKEVESYAIQLPENPPNQEQVEEKKKVRDLLTKEIEELGQNTGAIRNRLDHLHNQLRQKQELENKLQILYDKRDNLSTLGNLFKGSGFVNYVATVFLENLCALANQRFLKLSRNSLSLTLDEENNFLVCDRLHEGRLRSIKTLSGGQTFQAALCLALALADQIQLQHKAPQQFFFLDEGFGSQDKEALQEIFHTLRSLGNEKRIVGLISHVEEMQEEIDTHLLIYRDPVQGSTVRGSWE